MAFGGEPLTHNREMTRDMPGTEFSDSQNPFRAVIENRSGRHDILLVCEHASAHIPEAWGDLGLSETARYAHIAWDPGALDVARHLSRKLDACLVSAPISRLVYDLNRAPDQDSAMPARSEVFDVPGNRAISVDERMRRTRLVYTPFHDDLHREIARRIAMGRRPVLVTVHSFTPVYHGQRREVEFGVIHDADPLLARQVVACAPKGVKTALNAPYSAADGVTHTLRLQANPYGLMNVMLEIRNDLIATPDAAAAFADGLATCLQDAVASVHQVGAA